MARAASALAAAALFTLAAAGPALAAPSPWLEVDGNVRTDVIAAGVHDWANLGSGPANTCPAVPGVVNLSGSGGLFNCGSPGAGSAPPNPPTLTAAAGSDASLISTLFVVDPISSDTTACGGGDPTVLGGGLKNGDDINGFSFSTGSVPAKDDLGNVYAASRIRADGHPEIFFAAERLVNNGDSHMDFEFLQWKVTRTAGCSGTMSGHRMQGDLLVAVDFTKGGSLSGDSIYQWHCNPDPGPQPATGTVCDPILAGPHYQPIAPLPGTVTFLVNAAGPVPCGGWICRGNPTQLAVNDFMEGGIDLQVLPFNGCFNTFLPHTRTAQSFTSGLKDFTGPSALATCRTPGLPNTGLVESPGLAGEPDLAPGPPAQRAPIPAAVRLQIPRLSVDAAVQAVGIDAQGNVAVPSSLGEVAWYQPGPAPGDRGNALIDGHRGVRPGQAVFWDLARLRPGDLILVLRGDGSRLAFQVDGVSSYPRSASVPELFSNEGPARLSLITCTGAWDSAGATYQDRLVVSAHLLAGRLGP